MSMLRLIGVLVIASVIRPSLGSRNDSVDPTISWFLKFTPFFDLTKIPQIGEKCRQDFQTFLEGMDNLELWALKSETTISGLSM